MPQRSSVCTTAEWVSGKSFMGGTWGGVPDEPAKRALRAIDIRDGRIAWELPQEGRVNSAGGVLSTASGVVFFGSDDGAFAAADSKAGKQLWAFPSTEVWKSSPMTCSTTRSMSPSPTAAASSRSA